MKHLILIVPLFLVGCGFFQRFGTAMQTPDPKTGDTPTQVVIREVPHVIANPIDIPAWLQIVGAITGAVLTATGVVAVKQRSALAKSNKEILELTPEPEQLAKLIVDLAVSKPEEKVA